MEMQFKPIRIDGLSPFARGASGEVYRLDEETILKLYYEGFSEEDALVEKDRARLALVAGIPTAISFETVQVGQRRGVVYEMIQGPTMSEMIAAEPARAGELGGVFAEIAETLHHAEGRKTGLPRATEPVRYALTRQDYLPETALRRIDALLADLDAAEGYIHGDFHTGNVIMTKDGPILLDMGKFAVGSPLFDLAATYFSLFSAPEALEQDRSSFTGLSRKEAREFWQGFAERYFAGEPDAEAAGRLHEVVLLKKMRFAALYGAKYPPEYSRMVRSEVLDAFAGE